MTWNKLDDRNITFQLLASGWSQLEQPEALPSTYGVVAVGVLSAVVRSLDGLPGRTARRPGGAARRVRALCTLVQLPAADRVAEVPVAGVALAVVAPRRVHAGGEHSPAVAPAVTGQWTVI